MSSEEFNISMRKFLKQVGVTSQQQIEEAVRAASADKLDEGSLAVKMTLTIDEIGLSHVVEGTIDTGTKT